MQANDGTAGLLLRLHAGDGTAIAELAVRDLEWIRASISHRLGGVVRAHADTNDVVHSIFVQLLEQGPRFSVSSRDIFRRVMARIIENTLSSMARHFRAEKRRPSSGSVHGETVLHLEPDQATQPPERAARAEEHEWIRFAMELLDPLDHEILRCRDWDDLTFREVGERVGMQEDAARIRYGRAMRKLARCVQQVREGRIEEALHEFDSRTDGACHA